MGSNLVVLPGTCYGPVLQQQNVTASLPQRLAGIPDDLDMAGAVQFQVVVSGRPRELPQTLSDDIYRIVREAIVNAYRHSSAKKVEAEIDYRSGALRVAVRDNGRGIDPRDLQWDRTAQWGLREMRERAEEIGARLRVLSRVALGTEVELYVPSGLAFA